MDPLVCVISSCLALVVGLVVGYGIARLLDRSRLNSTSQQAASLLETARKEAENLLKEAELKTKEELYRKREEFDREAEEARNQLREQERRLEKREDALEQKTQAQLKKERSLENNQRKLTERRAEVEKRAEEIETLIQQQMQKLHEITGLSREQAIALLFERLENELSAEVAQRLQKHEEHIRAGAEEKSREILAATIQRYAAEHTADTTVSTVDIPSDDMKGRIIGREGRNIRTFEKATGVDVIVDDTPGVVIVSAFDNIRRETANLAL